MGMFDSFFLKVRCPYCGETSLIEFQIKIFDCVLNQWFEGDKIFSSELTITNGIVHECIGGCNSEQCKAWETKRLGYNSGFGRTFYVDISIVNGCVDKAINIRRI